MAKAKTSDPNAFLSALSALAQEITPALISHANRETRRALTEAATHAALARSLSIGLIALLTPSNNTGPLTLGDSLQQFLHDSDVQRELIRPLMGESPNGEELSTLFGEITKTASSSLGLDLVRGSSAYAIALTSAIQQEPDLANHEALLKAHQRLQESSHLSAIALQQITDAIANLPKLGQSSNTINANNISAENVVSGIQQIIHQHFYAQRAPSWEEHYLETVIKQCDPLDLAPIDETRMREDGSSGDKVQISDIFATLNLVGLTRRSKAGKRISLEDAILDQNGLLSQKQILINNISDPAQRSEMLIERVTGKRMRKTESGIDPDLPIQAIEAIAAMPHLVILGQPGGGKSSLVNHLATQLARRRLNQTTRDERLPGWPADAKPLPVKIVLREFAAWLADRPDTGSGAAGDVWDYLEKKLFPSWGCHEAFTQIKQRLTEDGGIIFFDGLDEVRADHETALRETICNAVMAFSGPLKKCAVVLTCREYAYQPSDPKRKQPDWRLSREQFPVVTLAALTSEQVDHFVHDWYRVTGPARGWDDAKQHFEAENLSNAIRDETRPYLMELAASPLLLTLIAQVHGRDGELPKDRADLYERAVKLLLDRWEARLERDSRGSQPAKIQSPSIYQQIGINAEGLSIALQAVAYEAHKRQGETRDGREGRRAANISEGLLLSQLKDHLGDDYGAAQIAARFIQQRAGLLLAQNNGDYSFPHRTFQEYLAARHIMRQGDDVTLARTLVEQDLEWWREVFLLAAGTQREKSPSKIRDLVEAILINLPEQELLVDHWARALLVEQTLHETRFRDEVTREPRTAQPGPYRRVYQSAQDTLWRAMRSDLGLAARERAQAGDVLARLGDPRFDPNRFYLPADDMLGFVHIPADPNFKIGTRSDDFERVMQALEIQQKDWDNRRDEINDQPTPSPEFYIARYPVTAAQWRACVEDKRRDGRTFEIREDSLTGSDNHPVINVSWHDAQAYCNWLNEQIMTGRVVVDASIGKHIHSGQWRIMLLSELEWEKAARGQQPNTIFSWGNTPDPNRANYAATKINGTSSVGCFAPNDFGCYDLLGNVLEWTRSQYQPYPYRADDGRESPNGERYAVRGGSWSLYVRHARCACRYGNTPGNRNYNLGVRIVVSPISSLTPLGPVASGR